MSRAGGNRPKWSQRDDMDGMTFSPPPDTEAVNMQFDLEKEAFAIQTLADLLRYALDGCNAETWEATVDRGNVLVDALKLHAENLCKGVQE